MKLYRVRNRRTGEELEVEATCAQDACARLNWMIGYCYVKLIRG